MESFFSSPYFGLSLSVLAYWIGTAIQRRLHGNPLANPLLISVALCALVLKFGNISYQEQYLVGGQYLTFFIAPATVAMVVNVYRNREALRRNLVPVLFGVTVGSLCSILSAYVFTRLFHMNSAMTVTVLPKSVTTAIGMPLSEAHGGNASITAIAIAFSGMSGAVLGPGTLRLFRVRHSVAKGVALGTTSHALGTATAMEMGDVEGAMGGLSIALAGFVTVLLLPLLLTILPM